MKLPAVVVTDGEQRAALAVVRSLGASGYRCIVTASFRGSLAGASRYAAAERVLPDPLQEPPAFAAAVSALVERENARVLVPITDAAMLAVEGGSFENERVCVPFPAIETVRAIADKRRVLHEAESLGLATPRQVVLESSAAIPDVDNLTFPVVLKPTRSVREGDGSRVKLGVAHAQNPAELQDAISRLPAAAFPLLIQERVVGPGLGVFLLIWDGSVRAAFAHRRLAEKPPWGGVSVHAESVLLDSRLLNRSVELLSRFGWQGVAMVEFKRHSASGVDYLMEINGRFWGSIQLAIDAGVNFPRLLVECALGRPEPPVLAYETGVRSRWSWGLVDHLVARIRNRAVHLPPGTAPGMSVLGALVFGCVMPRSRDSVWRWTDPMPFLRESR